MYTNNIAKPVTRKLFVFQASEVKKEVDTKEASHAEIAGSLNRLALAATAKQEMIDQSKATINALTSNNKALTANNNALTSHISTLTASNAKLSDQLAKANVEIKRLRIGMGQSPWAAPTPSSTTRTTIAAAGGAQMEMNSQGVPCQVQTGNGNLKR